FDITKRSILYLKREASSAGPQAGVLATESSRNIATDDSLSHACRRLLRKYELEHRNGAHWQSRSNSSLLRADAEEVPGNAELLRPRQGRLCSRSRQGGRKLSLVLCRGAAGLLWVCQSGFVRFRGYAASASA